MKLKHSNKHLKAIWDAANNPVDFFNVVDIEMIEDHELKVMCRTALYSLHAIHDKFKQEEVAENSELSNLKF